MKLKGILYGCISSGTYGLIPLFALPIMNKGIAFDSVLFYRFSCATVALAVLMLFRKVSFRIGQNEILPLITLGILFALSALCLFRSYNFMPAGIAATILFSYPIFVTLIMAVFFHEKISLIIITAITLAFTGIYLLYGGDTQGPLYTTGIVLVLLSALSYAVYLVIINSSTVSHMSGIKITFYAMTVSSLFFLLKTTSYNNLQILLDTDSIVNIILLALIPTIISCVTMVYSVHYIGSTATAVLGAMEPLTAVCVGIFVFGEPFSISLAIGMTLIILAVILIIVSHTLSKYLKEFQHFIRTEIAGKKP